MAAIVANAPLSASPTDVMSALLTNVDDDLDFAATAKEWTVRYQRNELQAPPDAAYPDAAKTGCSAESAADAREKLIEWEGYEPTPLVSCKEVAELAGVASVICKDESGRFGTGSFKALGGALAVADCFEEDPDAVVCTASAGNHGLGVAWGAKRVGLEARIYLGRTVSESIADKMRALGAEVVRIDGTYEESCEAASADVNANASWKLIQDGSSPGYEAVPARIHSGYALLAREMLEQLGALDEEGNVKPEQCPTHILANSGVGGLAAGLAGYLWPTLLEARPRFVIVEPLSADCLARQARADAGETLSEYEGTTVQVGLDCKEVSPLAWKVLGPATNDFVAVGDEVVGPCLKLLARSETPICAGESAVAGIGALLAAGQDPDLKAALGLDENSRVAVVICEAPPDAALYEDLTGEKVEAVQARRDVTRVTG